jgi:hypothetical protein
MDTGTLYMLAICTKAALCYPAIPSEPCDKGFCIEPSSFDMTKAECEAIIENRVRKDGGIARTFLFCLSEEEWIRRYPERPDLPIKPLAH